MKTSIGVVFLLTYLDSQTGGMERQALQLAQRLREQGCEIFFITCAHLGRMRRDHLRVIDLKEEFRVYRIPLFGGARYLNMVLYGIGAFILLALTRTHYHIIHAHQLYTSGLVASFAKVVLRSKKVLVKNAAGGHECGDVAELKRLKGYRFFIALLRRTVDQFVAVSQQTAQEMEDIGFTRIKVIPNGVDTDYFAPLGNTARNALRHTMLGVDADKQVVLFVGRLGPEKNLFTLLDAMQLLDPGILLCVVGDGILSTTLHQYAQEKGIAKYVHFVGPQNNIKQWYQVADVFVLPSHSEGSPNTLLEAMSSGVPSVGSDIPAIQYIITHKENGYLFPKDDPGRLALVLREILANVKLGTRLGINGRASAVYRFDLDIIAQQYVALYNTLLV